MKAFIEKIKRNWLSQTATTVVIIAILIAIFIALNLWVRSLNLSSIDVTPQKLFSLSDESKEQIKKIDKNVTIYFFGFEEDTSTVDLAKQYQTVNDKITVEIIDTASRPDLQEKYGLTTDTQAVVIQSDDKEKLLTPSDFYTYDYTTYESIDVTEQKLTNGIIETTIDEKPSIYILTNHGEYALDYTGQKTMLILSAYIENDVNTISSLDLLSEDMPEDCDVLVIASPSNDFSDIETDKIIQYIQKGGKILWLSDPNLVGAELPNVQKVLDLYGISFANGIIKETDSSKMAFQNPEFIKPNIGVHSITENLESAGGIMMMDATKINMPDETKQEELGLTVTTLLTSGSSSYFRTDLTDGSDTINDTDEQGEFTVGAEIQKKIDDTTTSTLIVYSNAVFASDARIVSGENYINAVLVYNNKDLVLNSIAYLNQREDSITIRKNTGTVTYTATQQEDTIIRIIIFTVPAVIVLVGIIVWQVRRRKK